MINTEFSVLNEFGSKLSLNKEKWFMEKFRGDELKAIVEPIGKEI